MKKYFWMIAILAISGVFASNNAQAQRYGRGCERRGGYSRGYERHNGYYNGGYGGGYRGGYAPATRVVVRGGCAPVAYAYGGYQGGYDNYGYDPYYNAPRRVRVVLPSPRIFIPRLPRVVVYGGGRGHRRW